MTNAKGELDPSARAAAAKDQLNLVLGFFARVDTKLSVVLGIDLGMLGLLLTKAPNTLDGVAGWIVFPILLFGVAMLISVVQLYRGSFPYDKESAQSLVFFRHIAEMDVDDFVRKHSNLSAEALADELLRQAWISSVILKDKFKRLKSAYIAMALAIIPWAFCLYIFIHNATPANH